MAGDAGSPEQRPDAGTAHFRAVLQGDEISFEILDPAWHITCDGDPLVMQKLGDTWTPLRDERPRGSNDALLPHYLDGSYEPICVPDSDCHITFCIPISSDEQLQRLDFTLHVSALEYLRVGERSGLTCDALAARSALDAGASLDAGSELDAGSDAGLQVVPDLESRKPTGPLALRFHYYRDSACQTALITTDVPVE